MDQIKVRRSQTIRLDLDFHGDMSGHALSLKHLFHISKATASWIDDAIGRAEILISSAETEGWTLNSTHRLTIATIAGNGDVEVWGTLEFKVRQ